MNVVLGSVRIVAASSAAPVGNALIRDTGEEDTGFLVGEKVTLTAALKAMYGVTVTEASAESGGMTEANTLVNVPLATLWERSLR